MKQFPTDKSSTDFDRLAAQCFITLHVEIHGAGSQISVLQLPCTLLARKWRGPTHPPNKSLSFNNKWFNSKNLRLKKLFFYNIKFEFYNY